MPELRASFPDGDALPRLRTAVPGPRSADLARRLGRVESRNVTCIDPPPIFWTAASGANVTDADGNRFIDLTAGFGVAAAGHANPAVAAAISRQAGMLAHGLGDVHPSDVRVLLLERLASIAPAPLAVSVLASSGAEAVEAALKTALLQTGRPGILAFTGSYHGLTYGALAATSRADFREPFLPQLYAGVRFAPFPAEGTMDDTAVAHLLDRIRAVLDESERGPAPVGAVIVEPIQGRGGIVPPAAGFLGALRALCNGRDRILIFDEVYTGIGRTGRWFACEHEDVLPDVLVAGKALAGSLPLSAAIGSPEVMRAWPPSQGEALHTSTFLGNPIACAAALAHIDEIESRGLLARARTIGDRIVEYTAAWPRRYRLVQGTRGRGALQGIVLSDGVALDVCARALRDGVIVLAEGERLDVLALTPPLVITDDQLDCALDVIEAAVRAVSG